MSDLSLFDIESGLHSLMDAWQDAKTPEEIQAAELAIREYAEAEVRKVDGIRRYLGACETQIHAAKAEMQAQAQRVRMWEARRDRLKAFCFDVMKSFGIKKLEGGTGSLTIRGNGGIEPLVITDETLLPDEMCDVTVTMSALEWRDIVTLSRSVDGEEEGWRINQFGACRVPSKKRIRHALENGTHVAGARLEPRGESLVVR